MGKLNEHTGASVVFAIVGFMFAAMVSLVVVSAAYSNALRLKSVKREEQMNLVAQGVCGVVTDALAGTDTVSSNLKIPENDEGSIIKQGYTLNYQFVDVTEGSTTTRYYTTQSGGVFGNDYMLKADSIGDDTSLFVEYGKEDASVVQMRKLISIMAKEILKSGNKNPATPVTLTASDELDGETYSITADISMNKNFELEIITTVAVGENNKYVVRLNADPVYVSQKETVKGIVDTNGASITSTGDQNFKVNDCYITWPASQITSVTSK
ncbi:MAG: hypothetical protein E7302_00215 [Butyrivibrio sp.]|nr:hypothetical protein [Butyrivibrio sp.]